MEPVYVAVVQWGGSLTTLPTGLEAEIEADEHQAHYHTHGA